MTIFDDTKHRAVSLRQQSYLLESSRHVDVKLYNNIDM